jgi:catechol 2,3-dioxygenase-like lactoylglutathione lyase family enzyme
LPFARNNGIFSARDILFDVSFDTTAEGSISIRTLILLLGLAAVFPSGAVCAQTAAPNETGVSMGHLHLMVSDVDAAQKFWIAMGATSVKFGQGQALKFPGVLILLRKGEPSGGTVGSVVNHFGFGVPNSKEALAKWNAAGLKTEVGQIPGQVFVFTPDGLTRVEILENPALTVPIAFHHVHFYVADPGGAGSLAEIKSWYVKMFGAIPGKRGQFEADDLPGVNLTFTKSDTPTVGTKGRVLDHIGFEIKNLEAFCKKAEASGVKFDTPYTKRPELGISMALLTDPWGTYIELTEGLNGL